MENRGVVHFFAEARSEASRVAAVLLLDGAPKYSDWQPAEDVLRFFQPRGDKQILSLGLLSIAFGLSACGEALAGKRVCIWNDNTGAEHTPKNGVAQAFDHTCLVHAI